MRRNALVRVTAKVVLEGPLPAREVAEKIGKPYGQLMRELDPLDRNAKLGVETVLDIVRVTGELEPLQRLARELGCVLTPAEAPPVARTVRRRLSDEEGGLSVGGEGAA
jgi:hypothetical protein